MPSELLLLSQGTCAGPSPFMHRRPAARAWALEAEAAAAGVALRCHPHPRCWRRQHPLCLPRAACPVLHGAMAVQIHTLLLAVRVQRTQLLQLLPKQALPLSSQLLRRCRRRCRCRRRPAALPQLQHIRLQTSWHRRASRASSSSMGSSRHSPPSRRRLPTAWRQRGRSSRRPGALPRGRATPSRTKAALFLQAHVRVRAGWALICLIGQLWRQQLESDRLGNPVGGCACWLNLVTRLSPSHLLCAPRAAGDVGAKPEIVLPKNFRPATALPPPPVPVTQQPLYLTRQQPGFGRGGGGFRPASVQQPSVVQSAAAQQAIEQARAIAARLAAQGAGAAAPQPPAPAPVAAHAPPPQQPSAVQSAAAQQAIEQARAIAARLAAQGPSGSGGATGGGVGDPQQWQWGRS